MNAVAGVGGLLIGWMMNASAGHRHRRHHPARRKRVNSAATPFFIAATYLAFMTFMLVANDFADGIDAADIQAPLALITFPGLGPLVTAMAAISGLAALILNTFDWPAATPLTDPPYPTVQPLT